MNLRSLRFFLAVAENNGVQKAAESLHLTQPNISRALKALEEELNAQLFVRTARGVKSLRKANFSECGRKKSCLWWTRPRPNL